MGENNETTFAPEAEETISDADLDAFDEEWEDAPITDDDDNLGDTEDVQTPDENPDTVTADNADSESDGDAKEESAEEDQPEADTEKDEGAEGHQLYTLKSLNGEKQYNIDDVLKLATKGLDYDGVRQDRDRIRTYEAFLKELAEPMKLSVDELIDNTRARMLIQQKKQAGEELSEIDAMNIVLRNKAKAAEAAAEKPAQDAEAAKNQMIQQFVREFPDVKADAIPAEVWAECNRTGDLAGAYRKYADGQKDKEIARLNKELKSLKQSQKNRDRSIGSLKSSGAPVAKDPFDEGWDSV